MSTGQNTCLIRLLCNTFVTRVKNHVRHGITCGIYIMLTIFANGIGSGFLNGLSNSEKCTTKVLENSDFSLIQKVKKVRYYENVQNQRKVIRRYN